MNLQAFGISALECLQFQNLSHPENRLSLKALAIVHGRRVRMTNQIASAMLALGFVAALIVAGQLYIEKSSTSTGRVIAATLNMPAR
jgi:hypothetical protein